MKWHIFNFKNQVYLVDELVRLVLEAFGACYKQCLFSDMAQKRPKFCICFYHTRNMF